MRLTDSQRDLLRIIGEKGCAYWDAFNEWQAYRGIPLHLLRPDRTFAKLERMGLIAMGEDDVIHLTGEGREVITWRWDGHGT